MPANRFAPIISKCIFLLALINIAFLIFYICIAYKYQFHSDDAVANLLAQEIRDRGHFFPPDWHYAYGDVWVVFLHAAILPLLFFMPNGYAVHAVAALLGAAGILWALWQLGAVTGMQARTRYAAIALFASGMSPNMAENLFGQQAYGVLFLIGAFILVASWRCLHNTGRRRWWWAALALALICLTAWGNPQRAVVYMVLPMLVAALATLPLGGADRSSALRPSRLAGFGVLALAASLAGARMHAAILGEAGLEQAITPAWLSFAGMGHNLAGALQGLLSLLGGLPAAGTPVLSRSGVLAAARLGAAATILVLLPWALACGWRSARPGQRYFAVATMVSLAVSLAVFIATTVPNAADPEAAIRYLVPGLAGAVLLLVQAASEAVGAPLRRLAAAAAMLVLAASAPLSFGLAQVNLRGGDAAADGGNPRLALVHFLQGEHARYGYATFWRAGQTTVLSDLSIKVRQVVIDNGLPRPQRMLGADGWYEAAYWRGPTFLLLSKQEAAQIDWPAMDKLCGAPRRRSSYQDLLYIEYDHNIAADLPMWSRERRVASRFPASAATPRNIGSYDADSGQVRAPKGSAGALRFGPYSSLPAGRYRLTFDIDAEGEGIGDFGRVEASGEAGKTILAAAPIARSGHSRLQLSFTLARTVHDVEYRILSNGNGALAWSAVELQPLPSTPPAGAPPHGR